MAILARVTGDLDAPRGPDVALRVFVRPEWLGKEVEITIPRNVHCAACEGGGCDRCRRSGAITLQNRQEERIVVAVGLPDAQTKGESDFVIRVPDLGGRAEESGLPCGHLLLRFTCTSDAARLHGGPQVTLRASGPGKMHHEERVALAKRSLIMAAVVTLLFLGMLRLSGWL